MPSGGFRRVQGQGEIPAEAQRVFRQFMTPERRGTILRALWELAEAGHFKAAELLLAYDMGRPQVSTDVSVTAVRLDASSVADWTPIKYVSVFGVAANWKQKAVGS